MKELLAHSARDVNADLALVVFLGTLSFLVTIDMPEKMLFFPLLLAAMSVILVVYVLVYGRIACRTTGNEIPHAAKLIKTHWRNCFLVLFVIVVPVVLLEQLIRQFATNGVQVIILSSSLKFVVDLITMFALPIVFLRRIGLTSIIAGAEFTVRNIVRCLPVVLVVAAAYVVSLALIGIIIFIVEQKLSVASILLISWVSSVVPTYLEFVAFSSAIRILTTD